MSRSELPAANRRWLIVNAVLVTALINAILNLLIAYGTVGDRDTIPFWGAPLVEPSVFWDLVGTLFLLPLITSGVITAVVRRDIRRGTLPPPAGADGRAGAAAAPGWRRGAQLGVVSVFSVTPPLLLIFAVLGFPEMSDSTFIAWHTGLAVVLGLVVTPMLAILAMSDSGAADRSHQE